jgi:hypothetical protein
MNIEREPPMTRTATQTIDRAPTLEELNGFAFRVQDAIDTHYARQGYTSKPPTVVVMPGRKFARIVKDEGHSRSVYCFVCRATGRLYKAASWKGPARNYTRGSIFNADQPLNPWSVS